MSLKKLLVTLTLIWASVCYASPQRIISLAPNLTEILFAIGAGKAIVGVSAYSNYPAAAKKIPLVANANQIDLEAIVAKKPTMVVAWKGGNSPYELDEIKRFHIPIYTFAFKHINDIPAAMIRLGKLSGHEKMASQQAKQFNLQLEKLTNESKKRVRIFYMLWQRPLLTVGKTSLINQAITFCGGENIFADINRSSAEVSIASILKRNPSIIISSSKNKNWQRYWKAWPQINAVKHHQLYFINPDLLQRPGPRFVKGVKALCELMGNNNFP